MNERIRLLAEQCGFRSNPNIYDRNQSFDIPMFAQLIVQDMLGLLEQYSRDSFPKDFVDEFDRGYLAGLYTAQKAVKKHFGVEE